MPHAERDPGIVIVPCLADNYAYLVPDPAGGSAILVDAPEPGPIEAALAARGWSLPLILITHHHSDHVAGVEALRARYGARVFGPAAEAAKLPPLDRGLSGGDRLHEGGWDIEVLAVPGHTLGHLAYHLPGAGALFTADSLMAGGCGRLFEGTAAQMWDSLSRLAALPPGTEVFSGHEYTTGNLRFALSLEPGNAALISRAERVAEARRKGRPTVPASLAEEQATNPFLRAGTPGLKEAVGMAGAPDWQVFGEIRARKDRFAG